jgi:sugar/nucleoside kinase (ribokinase family)
LPLAFFEHQGIFLNIMETTPLLRFVIAGQLRRDYILLPEGKHYLDQPGGNALYTAAGLAVWETGCGLISRVGEDYPDEWLEKIARKGFDRRGIHVLPESIDLRSFVAYPDLETANFDNPISHFARLGLPFPKSLLGYTVQPNQFDSRNIPKPLTIRHNDFPSDYLDATAAHLCPLDYLSHTLLPQLLRQGHISTITLDPSAGYMNPTFLDDLPVILGGITAFLPSEQKVRSLFEGKTEDLWEMAEALSNYGCEIIVIKRGMQGQYVYEHTTRSRWIIPSYSARVFDPTGAGSAFCGGFLAGYRNSYDPLEAALYGNIASSLVIEGSGPFYALDTLPGLANARLGSLRNMVRKL